jgi:hypothetical protein
MSEDLIIRGSLEESSLPELLRSIMRSRESGILTCHLQEYLKSIQLQDGQIIFASSNNQDDRLGESLIKYGRIQVKQYLDAKDLVRPGKRLGAVLCEMNVLSPEELVDGVRNQVLDIIRGLFDVSKGNYELVLKQIDTQEMIVLNISTEDIIFDGVKSISSWSRIAKGIGPLHGKLVPAPDANKILMNLTLDPEETHLFSLCEKGQFTIEDICAMSYMNNFETCRHLWAFMMVGALEEVEPADRIAPGTPISTLMDEQYDLHDLVESYNELFAHIYDYAFQRLDEKADVLASRAMVGVQESVPAVVRNLKLDRYGRIDSDSVVRNVSSIPENGRMEVVAGALEEILYALLYEIGTEFGPSDQKELTIEVQQMRKK